MGPLGGEAPVRSRRERRVIAAYAQLNRLMKELEREELFHAVCYLAMALDVMRADHPDLLGGR